ncbi:alpha-amylase family glycosyl hydrolase [Chondromyces crocatus]|uniref:Alpha-amylase n=1 Tax=Chondromyces crocatus TaxID=52 RepID=A0A0K1EIR6_CHOCO|nr:alpha-amylase family glycosyl hydrolase [Chondromyces crocatus]AKT40755.1 alpha-amylase [Chondromyces crocatus]
MVDALAPDTAPWWRRATVYHVYPRSFADANGDGIGDLPGLIDKLDYLADLGVDALWISPFFTSPQRDFGYDIADYDAIAPEYGTLDDALRLFREAHARGLKVVLDLVLNHTSDEHPWFRASRDPSGPHRDHYLWRPGKRPGPPPRGTPPNNWKAMTGGSGWQHDPTTDTWYWASFLPFQPDLNYRNPDVRAAMLDVAARWLDRGADGFRLDIFNALYKDEAFRDNPFSFRPLPSERTPDGFFQRRLHTSDLPETLTFARDLRAVCDRFPGDRFLVGEVFGSPARLRSYLGPSNAPGLHAVFLFKTLRTRAAAPALRHLLQELERDFPAPHLPTWVLGNHDQIRILDRLDGDERRMRLLATLQLTARALPFIYYGEELGLRGPHIPLAEALDPLAARYRWAPETAARLLTRAGITLNRDVSRAPMPWTAAPGAGFSPLHVTPWRPLHPDHPRVNVATLDADPTSLLWHYRRLLRLRRARPALSLGTLTLLDARPHEDALLGYRRQHGTDTLDIWLNTSDRPHRVYLDGPRRPLFTTHGTGDEPQLLASRDIELRPWEAVILDASP